VHANTPASSGVAGLFLTSGATNHNCCPSQKLRTLKKSQLLAEIYFICFNNLKSVRRRFFHLKIHFAAPCTLLPRGGRTTRPTLAKPLTSRYKRSVEESTDKNDLKSDCA
jgi:hypothetical protein